jgi:hypothetical protein
MHVTGPRPRRRETLSVRPVPGSPGAAVRRPRLAVAASLLVACSHVPVVDPAYAGCYDVRVDSLGPAHRALGIEEPPTVILIDSLQDGRVLVPHAWLDAARPWGSRRPGISQARPAHTIRDGALVDTRETGTLPLPRDSMLFTLGYHTASLNARLAKDAAGNWTGTAWTWPNQAPFVTVRLLTRTCPMIRFGVPPR